MTDDLDDDPDAGVRVSHRRLVEMADLELGLLTLPEKRHVCGLVEAFGIRTEIVTAGGGTWVAMMAGPLRFALIPLDLIVADDDEPSSTMADLEHLNFLEQQERN